MASEPNLVRGQETMVCVPLCRHVISCSGILFTRNYGILVALLIYLRKWKLFPVSQILVRNRAQV